MVIMKCVLEQNCKTELIYKILDIKQLKLLETEVYVDIM